ncbi:MAG TPA: 3-ketosteroid-delta-1-dehydrogenase [Fodinibius sp.]|nr:3-ketosteroid-delta-1-dehydrogenase [Fodinibius sp.]
MDTSIENGSAAKDISVDVLIVGSGTGMATALAAKEKGLDSLIIEKTDGVGGSTARSGGGIWIPANPTLLADGSDDNLQKAEKYLEAIVEDPPNNAWKSFLKNGPDTIDMLLRTTPMKFFWSKGYSDYHPEEPGGDPMGRTIECKPFDLKRLGDERDRLRPAPMASPIPMPVTGYGYKWMNLMLRKPFKSFPLIFKRLFQGLGGMLIGKEFAAGGQALAAGLFAGVINADIPVWTNTELIELVLDGNRVVGAIAERNEKKVTINVNRGVVLSAGGFDHNMPMRQKYQSPSLTKDLSLGAEGNTGDAINIAKEVKADTALMNESWWFPSVAPVEENGEVQVLLAERSLPGSFMVDGSGNRFINECMDYMSFGQTLLKREKEGSPVGDMWLIFDQKYRNNYILAGSIFPRMPLPDEWYEAGIAFKADTPKELAQNIGLSKENFDSTYDRFNRMAATGKDEDFHRGESAYDRYYGDPTVEPNPNLRPLNGKLYAVKVVLSDLGTCGGLVADEFGRVLQEDETPIEGLYAIGNTSANIFGRVYPGAGATIGQGLVSGYIAANHIASTKKDKDTEYGAKLREN